MVISLSAVMVSTLASFNGQPKSVAISQNGTFALLATDGSDGQCVRFIDLASAKSRVLAGSGIRGSADGQGTSASFSDISDLAISNDDSFAVVADRGVIRHIVIATSIVTTLAGGASKGSADGVGTMATFYFRGLGIALAPSGTYALISQWSFNGALGPTYRIRRLDMTTKNVTTVSGTAAA
jgi:hypothetical protein